jgi:hypothetical protein
LQLRNIFLDQQRVSDGHTQPPVPSTSLILIRANTLALILIPTLPVFSLCRTSRFIRIGITSSAVYWAISNYLVAIAASKLAHLMIIGM